MIVEISVNEITHDGFWFVMVRRKISISTKTFCLITHYPFAILLPGLSDVLNFYIVILLLELKWIFSNFRDCEPKPPINNM